VRKLPYGQLLDLPLGSITGSISNISTEMSARMLQLPWILPEKPTPLITEIEIRRRTDQLARSIAADANGKPLVVILVLKGSLIFGADLLRRLFDYGVMPQVDFIRAASYGSGDVSSGRVSLQLDASLDLSEKDVILLDDITDTGLTLEHLVNHLKRKGAGRVRTCVLLDKPARRVNGFAPDLVGFEIPDRFVVGYGLDYAEEFRNLPFITTLEPKE
jgi:hypoxanthine phosphoribosyltransferase